jgi:hypothetical protein
LKAIYLFCKQFFGFACAKGRMLIIKIRGVKKKRNVFELKQDVEEQELLDSIQCEEGKSVKNIEQ